MIWAFSSGFFGGLAVVGSCTAGPFWSMGVTTMKMISSTRTTSTSGVTLISDFTASALMTLCMRRLVLLQEEVHELRGGVGHLDLEALEPGREVVERHDRGDRDEEPERGRDQRLGDSGGDRADAAGAGGRHARERLHDAHDRSEEPDERR